jgi:hypothetical protein
VQSNLQGAQVKHIEWHLSRCDSCRWALTTLDPISFQQAKSHVIIKPKKLRRTHWMRPLARVIYGRGALLTVTGMLITCTLVALGAIALAPLWTPLDELLIEPALSSGRFVWGSYQDLIHRKPIADELSLLRDLSSSLEFTHAAKIRLDDFPSPPFAVAFLRGASALVTRSRTSSPDVAASFLRSAKNVESKCRSATTCATRLASEENRQARSWAQWALLAGYVEVDRVNSLDPSLVRDFTAWAVKLPWHKPVAQSTFLASVRELRNQLTPYALRTLVWQLVTISADPINDGQDSADHLQPPGPV